MKIKMMINTLAVIAVFVAWQPVYANSTPTMCPDGSYVYGSCYLLPNGTHIGK